MISYNTYTKLIEILDTKGIEEAKKYLDREVQKEYLQKAKKALDLYLKHPNAFISYTYQNSDQEIMICDFISGYILDSDELIKTNSKMDRIVISNKHRVMTVSDRIKEIEELSTIDVDSVYSENKDIVGLWSKKEDVEHYFAKKNFGYAKKILGDDVEYKTMKEAPICVARSRKGKGIIFGLKKEE